jgi:hypothetical protein
VLLATGIYYLPHCSRRVCKSKGRAGCLCCACVPAPWRRGGICFTPLSPRHATPTAIPLLPHYYPKVRHPPHIPVCSLQSLHNQTPHAGSVKSLQKHRPTSFHRLKQIIIVIVVFNWRWCRNCWGRWRWLVLLQELSCLRHTGTRTRAVSRRHESEPCRGGQREWFY